MGIDPDYQRQKGHKKGDGDSMTIKPKSEKVPKNM
jgi:hypothetical protein